MSQSIKNINYSLYTNTDEDSDLYIYAGKAMMKANSCRGRILARFRGSGLIMPRLGFEVRPKGCKGRAGKAEEPSDGEDED